jgi:D-beta-D-heptose 7-phosphate kinase/D-beta-D-heptose 1-phosphate adenosyltransferase
MEMLAMSVTLEELGPGIAGLNVLVIGDAMLDVYLSGVSHRLCQEAPVPIVDVTARLDAPGGAGNCAANVAALGAKVSLLAVTGNECDGELLLRQLDDAGVRVDDVLLSPARRTLSKSRVLCDNHLIVRFDQGTTTAIDGETERLVLARLERLFPTVDAVIVSDYRYGVLTPAVIDRLAQLQRQSPRTLVVDSKTLPAYRHVGMTACKPNYRETLQLLGAPRKAAGPRRWHALLSEGDRILELTGAQVAAVSLDCEGALFFERGRPVHRTYAQAAPQERAAGAGDTFLSTLALALAAGAETPVAADLAAAAAAVVVAKHHTATCSWNELKHRYEGQCRPGMEWTRLQELLKEYRRQGRQIVLTNGCFDILHRGHITYLEQAKQLGDVLIVGVNTDESIHRLKGPARPINSLADRVGVLQGLSSVDHVFAFDEDTPHELIRVIEPDVFVKGGDYTRETLPEAELVEQLGGTIKILPFVADRSTTSIISRICRTYAPVTE